MRKPTILLVDDHVIFVEGLRRLLESDFQIVGVARDSDAMISEFVKLRPDVVIADISTPGLIGFQAARILRQRDPRAKIIFLTMRADPASAGEALNAGAVGYVAKQSAAREVGAAIRQALQGKTYVTSGSGADHSSGEKAPKLTERQREVLRLIAAGSTATEIADTLRVSRGAVQFHVCFSWMKSACARLLNSRDSRSGIQIHELSRGLSPSAVEDLGLEAALRAECESFSRQYQIPCQFSGSRMSEPLPHRVALCLYRVVEETLRDVSLRAATERVEVHLDRNDVAIGLTVVDFGRGFRVKGESRSQGLGLVGIEERVRMIGGEFSITSAEGQGTTLVIRVPLQEEKSK